MVQGTFKGVFDGNNKTINIGFTSNAGTIKNLNIINTKLLDGGNDGTIENCNVSIDDKPSFIYPGVICKYNRGIINVILLA